MKLTLFINAEHQEDDDLARRFAEHTEQVRVARDVGFDGVAVGMHLSYGSSAWFPPLELLTSLAPVAKGMSLASSMLILPLFHPLHVAQQAAYLDIVSGGRLILGVAPGWTEDEFKVMDLNYKTRISAPAAAPCDVVRRQCGEGGGAGGGSGGSNTRRQLGGVLASRQRCDYKAGRRFS